MRYALELLRRKARAGVRACPGICAWPSFFAVAAAAFRLPFLGFPTEEYLRRGLPREDRAAVPRGREPRRMGPPAHREAADRHRGRGLRLRALGLAAARRPRRHRPRPRLLPLRAARAAHGARGGPGYGPAPRGRGVPRAEPHRHDQHLRGPVSARGGPLAGAGGAEDRAAGARHGALRDLPRPRPLHALDQPLGRGLPRSRPPRGARAAAPAAAGDGAPARRLRASSPVALRPELRPAPRAMARPGRVQDARGAMERLREQQRTSGATTRT